MPKTVSARIENDMHEELIDRCNALGCRVSDFVRASIEFSLYDYVNFDFGGGHDDEGEPSSHEANGKKNLPIATPGRVRLVLRD